METTLVSVIAGIILGGVFTSLGYHYKSRVENKSKINIALFNLLEIWSVVGMTKLIYGDKFFNKFIQRIKTSFPKENIDSETEALIRLGMEQSMPILFGHEQGRGNHHLNSYLAAVSELAAIDPFYASQLNKNQGVIKFLDAFDSLFDDIESTDNNKSLSRNMKSFISSDAYKELEHDLKILSKKSGYLNYWRTSRHIKKVKGKFVNIPDSIFDSYIEHVIAPIIQDHYDKLGISNPNLPNKM